MLVEKYKNMLSGKSVIRQLSEFATARGQEIGYENVFDYSLGNPSVPVPKAFTDRMIQMLATKNPMELHGYSPSLGITSVREAIAESLEKRFGIPYRKEHIFMASGAAGALAHAFRLVTKPGDEILTFAPFFPEYHPYVDLTGAVLRVVPPNTETFQINVPEFEQMITEKVMAVLINTPNNPSGVVYSTETIETLAEIMTRKSKQYGHEIYLISDEPYREIVFEGVDAPCVSKFYDNTIMCYSFSKSLSLPGERIGYVAINPACEDAETMVRGPCKTRSSSGSLIPLVRQPLVFIVIASVQPSTIKRVSPYKRERSISSTRSVTEVSPAKSTCFDIKPTRESSLRSALLVISGRITDSFKSSAFIIPSI